jgi:hypothetical protein
VAASHPSNPLRSGSSKSIPAIASRQLRGRIIAALAIMRCNPAEAICASKLPIREALKTFNLRFKILKEKIAVSGNSKPGHGIALGNSVSA